MISIFFNPNESQFSKLQVEINNQPVEYTLTDNKVDINSDVDIGLNQLSIEIIHGTKFSIEDVVINHTSVRQAIYLSYIETQDCNVIQPATCLWEPTQKWILPFANPISFWLCLVMSKIPANTLGKNLYETYNIIYPSKVILNQPFISLINDFFRYNFDFFCELKTKPNLLPIRKTNINFYDYDTATVIDEIDNNIEFIKSHQRPYSQKIYNYQEISNNQPKWFTFTVIEKTQVVVDPEKFKRLLQLVNQLPLNDITSVCIGILPPGGIIAPHIDNIGLQEPGSRGHNILYFPLNWPEGNYFKFYSGCLIDSTESIWAINNSDHIHGLVNQSTQERKILTITFDPVVNSHILDNCETKIY